MSSTPFSSQLGGYVRGGYLPVNGDARVSPIRRIELKHSAPSLWKLDDVVTGHFNEEHVAENPKAVMLMKRPSHALRDWADFVILALPIWKPFLPLPT
jgi:hypothetical protein